MRYGIHRWIAGFACGFALLSTAGATSVARLSFEELTDQSELVVSGQVNRSWAEWDAEHKYIWTRYELSVSGTLKGSAASSVVFSEPGGTVGDTGMSVPGSVGYAAGEEVVIFLQRMPNGYLRTAGWSQGKFRVDQTGKLHGEASQTGLEIVGGKARTAIPLQSLDGLNVAQLRGLIAARAQAKPQGRTQ
jgi:hypothetical protein